MYFLEHLVMQEEGVYLVNTSYKNRIATYRLLSKKDPISVNDFLANLREKIIALVRCQIERFGNVKVGMELFGRFLLQTKEVEETKSFGSRFRGASQGTDLEELFDQFTTIIKRRFQEFNEKDSGKYI